MGKLEAQIQSEYDSAGMALEGSVFVAEARHSKLPLLSTGMHIQSWRYRHVKRWIDVAGSLGMIAVSLIPGLLIAATIALTSEGPVFYRETRIGRGGRPFRIWKFRSMCTKTQWQEVVKAGSTDGISCIGECTRASAIRESLALAASSAAGVWTSFPRC